MFNHPIQPPPFEKTGFNFDPNSNQIKMEDNSQALGESSSKRRRKAPPKKHPSFEESCEWVEDEGEDDNVFNWCRCLSSCFFLVHQTKPKIFV